MPATLKTAISLTKEDFERLEVIRKQTHTSRSQVLREAFRTWLKLREQEALEQRYVAGYERYPEIPKDLHAFYQAGLASLASQGW